MVFLNRIVDKAREKIVVMDETAAGAKKEWDQLLNDMIAN